MKETMRENDILLATMQKPDITNVDLLRNNINLGNTLLLDKEKYKESPLIKEKFSKNGVFDNELFDQYYQLAQDKYNSMQEDQLMTNLVDNLEYSQTSFFRKPGDKTYSNSYKGITFKDNPLQQAYGIEGINYKSAPTKTEKEVAQSHAIWDPVNKKWLSETAENRNFLNKFFGESLVYAKYTKDGMQENPITGQMEYHQKGEYIKDDEGNYFTQLAGSADLINGTEIVKLQDILSSEDSWWNKIDFFDSDSLDKSVGGTVMKTLVSTIPYFLPYVGPVYTTASILVGLGENLPQIAKSVDNVLGWQTDTDEFNKGCNQVVNWFSKFSPSVSQYGQEHFLSLENVGQLTADLVGQLYQQRGVASLSKYITKTTKSAEELKTLSMVDQYKHLEAAAKQQQKIAKALALGYMSLVQAGDIYNDALEGGYDRNVAGLATLMSTAAFFGIMNYNESLNGLGTWFLDKTTGYDREFARYPISKLAKQTVRERAASKELQSLYREGNSKFSGKMHNYWLNFWNKIDDAVRVGGEGAWTNALAEGIEEVSEEVVQDGVKGLIDGLNYLGYTQSDWGNPEASFGGWGNVFSKEGLERYIQTFVGGAFGGAMFHVTQNKVKPFTDSLFGIETDVPKPVNYDLIDIALRGLGDTYMQEVDRAVRFIDDRQLDLSNSEDLKMYNAREAIATTLKNEMRVAQDLVDGILAGADFKTAPQAFREQIRMFFKPMINNTGAINYIQHKFEHNVHELANVLGKIKDIEKQIDENKSGLDLDKAKADLKTWKEKAKLLREGVIGFFNGKSYIDAHDEASWLINKDLFGSSKFNMTDAEYYENIIKQDGDPEFVDLVDSSTDPETITKEYVKKQRELFERQVNNNFDPTHLPELFERLPIVNNAFKAMTKLIGKGLEGYSTDLRRLTVLSNAIKKMQLDRDLLEQKIQEAELLSLLTPEARAQYETASDEEKAKTLEEARLQIAQQIVESFSIQRLIELIKADPNAFSLADRYNIDYASQLESTGIITLDPNLTPEQQKVVRTLINSEFANVPLSTLSKENIQILLDNIQAKLSSETNYFGLMFKQAANPENNALITGNQSLITFDVNIDNFTDDLKFIKLDNLNDYINTEEGGINDNLISEDIYNYLLDQYKRLDAEFLQKLMSIDPDLEEAAQQYLEDPNAITYKQLTDTVQDICQDDILRQTLLESLNIQVINPELSLDEITKAEKTAVLSAIDNNLKAWKFVESTKGRDKVENIFTKVIDRISFSIGNDAKTTRFISKQITKWAEQIRQNKGLAVDESITNEQLEHISNVLQILTTVVKTMSPVFDSVNGEEHEGIQQRNKNFARAMGFDAEADEYYILDAKEAELLTTMVGEMQSKLKTLRSIYNSMEEEQAKRFEEVRENLISNQFALYRYHIARNDDDNPLYIEELAEQIKAEEDTEFTLQQKLEKILLYRQALYQHFKKIDFTGYSSREEFLVNKLMETFGKENGEYKDDIFYFGDPATIASKSVNSNNAYASFLLADLVGLVGLNEKYSPKVIESAILKAFEDTQMYPRQDQIYDISLAIQGILAKSAYSKYEHILEDWYNDETSKGALKQYVENLIKIPGPAGSGKTALYGILLKALENLEVSKPIVISAQQQFKVDNIQSDLKDISFNSTISYSNLNNLITNLQERNNSYRSAESEIFTALSNTKLSDIGENTKIDNFTATKTDNEVIIHYDNNGISLVINLPIENNSVEISNAKITINDSSFEGLDFNGINLDEGLLVLDECTNLSPFEWQALNKLAREKNFSILATGDQYQRGYRYLFKQNNVTQTAYIGDENILGLYVPALESVHRAMNSATSYNERSLRQIAQAAIQQSKEKSHEGLKDFAYTNTEIKNIQDSLAALKLQYTLSNESYGLLGADITHSQEDFEKALDSIKDKANKSLLLIVQDRNDIGKVSNLLSSLGFNPDKVKVVTIEDVQGAEADYAIAYNIQSSRKGALIGTLSDLKEIYTLVTRGRYGFISFGEDDIFSKNELESSAEQPVVVTSTIGNTESGKNWLEFWKLAIENVADIQEEQQEPEQEVTPGEEVEQPEPEAVEEESEEVTNSKTSTNISNAFAGHNWLVMRQYGYHPGISINTINEVVQGLSISKENTESLLRNESILEDSSFRAFLNLLNGNFVYFNHDAIIGQFIEEAKQKSNYIDGYIYFINKLREAAKNSKLKAYSFLKKQVKSSESKDDSNVAYKKVNDHPEQAGDILRTVGIPIFDSSTGVQTGHIVLGVVGYDKDTDAEGNNISSIDQDHWWRQLNIGETVIKYVTTDLEKIVNHQLSTRNYYSSVSFKQEVKNTADNNTGPIVQLTNLRDFRIESDWQGNIDPANVDLSRASWNEFLALGYEIVNGLYDSFIINPDDPQKLAKFKEWYNKYRFTPLTEEKLKLFKSLLDHAGTFVVARPTGTNDPGFPILLKQVVSWEQFIDTARSNKGKGKNLSAYGSLNILYALTKALKVPEYSNLSFSELKQKIRELGNAGRNEFLSALSDAILERSNALNGVLTTNDNKGVLDKLYNTVLLGAEPEKYKDYLNTLLTIDELKTNTRYGTPLLDLLNKVARNYPYISVTSTNVTPETIVERVFEQSNNLIDLEMLQDENPYEVHQENQAVEILETPNLTEDELATLLKFLSTALSDSFTMLSTAQRHAFIKSLFGLVQKMTVADTARIPNLGQLMLDTAIKLRSTVQTDTVLRNPIGNLITEIYKKSGLQDENLQKFCKIA